MTNAYYHEMGILDCIAKSGEAYVKLAVRLGTDFNWRAQIELKIKNKNKHLFKRFEVIDEFEDFFKSSQKSLKRTG